MSYGDTERIDWLERACAMVHVGPEQSTVTWSDRTISAETVRQAIDRAAGLDQWEPARWRSRPGRPAQGPAP